MTASAEMLAYADELRRQRAVDPRDDIVTLLTGARAHGGDGATAATGESDGLTDAELAVFFLLLVVAGNETTRNATSHGMRALIEHPAELAKLRADPSPGRMTRAVEEILRWASPILYFRRTATRDVELRGKTIRAGDRVVHVVRLGQPRRRGLSRPVPLRRRPVAQRTRDLRRRRPPLLPRRQPGPHGAPADLHRAGHPPAGEVELDGPVEMLRSNFIGGIKHMRVRWDMAVAARRERFRRPDHGARGRQGGHRDRRRRGIGGPRHGRWPREGASVAVVDIDGARAEEVAQAIAASGGSRLGVPADLSEEAEVVGGDHGHRRPASGASTCSTTTPP